MIIDKKTKIEESDPNGIRNSNQKHEIEKIEKILESNMNLFPLCSRVVVTQTVNELGLTSGMYGTVFSIDTMGNITVCWDDLMVTTTNYLSYEFMMPNIFSIFTDTVPKYFNFCSFIESLRNTFQKDGLYIEGRTEDLDIFEIEKIVTFSLDKMMKDSFNGYSFFSQWDLNKNNKNTEKFEKIEKIQSTDIMLFDCAMNKTYSLSELINNYNLNSDKSLINIFDFEKYLYIINYLSVYISNINDSLKSLTTTSSPYPLHS